MKKNPVLLLIVLLIMGACTKVKNDTPTIPLDNSVDTTVVMSRYSGSFINGPYGSVSGAAKIYFQNNQFILALEELKSSNGPDLHVYLSKELYPINFIDLGRLQSVSGNQLYPITGNPDFSDYKYALVHCQRYNHLFGSALLR